MKKLIFGIVLMVLVLFVACDKDTLSNKTDGQAYENNFAIDKDKVQPPGKKGD